MTDLVLPATFALAALVYSAAGFGGGSAYLAIMALAGVATERMPLLALLCNLVVVASGAWHFTRARQVQWSLLWPFLVGSVPMSLLGGRIHVGRAALSMLLGVSLAAAGGLLLRAEAASVEASTLLLPKRSTSTLLGAGLGLLSGMIGIGGGVFLAPLLLHRRWAAPRQVAALCSFFIFVNSLAGLWGQWLKNPAALHPDWMILVAAVFVGGQIGSQLGARRLSQTRIRQLTGALVLVAGLQILARLVLS